MNSLKQLVIVVFCCLAAACHTYAHYEYQDLPHYGTVMVQNGSSGFWNRAIMKPHNRIYFGQVNGREVVAVRNGVLHVAPGKHHINVYCESNGKIVGQKDVTIHVIEGRTYTIAYPADMHGDHFDGSACQKLIIQ